VGTVDLHHVEPGLPCTYCGRGKGFPDDPHVVQGHFFRRHAIDQGRLRGRAHSPSLVQEEEALPAAMVKLDAGPCTPRMNPVRQSLQAGDEPVVIDPELGVDERARFVDRGYLGYDETGPGLCSPAHIREQLVADGGVPVPQAGPHGGHDHPVRQFHPFNGSR